jgi:hypothetical protein
MSVLSPANPIKNALSLTKRDAVELHPGSIAQKIGAVMDYLRLGFYAMPLPLARPLFVSLQPLDYSNYGEPFPPVFSINFHTGG